jgi:phosphonatase-like hydrolase
MIELAIFDIAGTLIEDHNEVSDAFLEALRNNSIEVSDAEIKEWKGSAKRQVIAHFVERQFGRCRNLPLIDRIYNEFRFRLEEKFSSGGIVPIAGAVETLALLRANGMTLATTTGFYREVQDRILDTLQWRDRFDAHVCSDDVEHGRPAPDMIRRAMELCGVLDPGRVLNVGDTPLDLQSGTSAGCGFVVGVLTGTHTRERLEKEPHTHLIGSVAMLFDVLEEGHLRP